MIPGFFKTLMSVGRLRFINQSTFPAAESGEPELFRYADKIYHRLAGGLANPLPTVQTGTATLAAGTITVSATLTADSKIIYARNTAGGSVGHLNAPAASRNVGAGSFVINSSDAGDTSTVDWAVITQ